MSLMPNELEPCSASNALNGIPLIQIAFSTIRFYCPFQFPQSPIHLNLGLFLYPRLHFAN